jgi:hypothetical protein
VSCCGRAVAGAAGLVRAAVAYATGIGSIPDPQLRERLAACQACLHRSRRRWFCSLCGCLIVAKARLPDQTCPAAPPRWPSPPPSQAAGLG